MVKQRGTNTSSLARDRTAGVKATPDSTPPARAYYYLDKDNQPVGPHTAADLAQLEGKGIITAATMVASDGDKEWKSWAAIAGGGRVAVLETQAVPAATKPQENIAGSLIDNQVGPQRIGIPQATTAGSGQAWGFKTWLLLLIGVGSLLAVVSLALSVIGGTKPTGDESSAWASATRLGTPAAFVEFARKFPSSSYIRTETGTLRGRFWVKMEEEKDNNGVIVTVKGRNCLLNLPLAEAIRRGVIRASTPPPHYQCEAKAASFNYVYVEMLSGGYIMAARENGEIVKRLLEPVDIDGTTIVLSADGKHLLGWDVGSGRPNTVREGTRTIISAAAASMPEFKNVPASLSKQHTPESQELTVASKME